MIVLLRQLYGTVMKNSSLEVEQIWVLNFVPPLTGRVNSSHLRSTSLHVLTLKGRIDSNNYFYGFVEELFSILLKKKIMFIKCLAFFLAHSKNSFSLWLYLYCYSPLAKLPASSIFVFNSCMQHGIYFLNCINICVLLLQNLLYLLPSRSLFQG